MQKSKWEICINLVPLLTASGSILYMVSNYMMYPSLSIYSRVEHFLGTFYIAGLAVIFYLSEILLRKNKLQNTKPASFHFLLTIMMYFIILNLITFILFMLLPDQPWHRGGLFEKDWFGLVTVPILSLLAVPVVAIYSWVRVTLYEKYQMEKTEVVINSAIQ